MNTLKTGKASNTIRIGDQVQVQKRFSPKYILYLYHVLKNSKNATVAGKQRELSARILSNATFHPPRLGNSGDFGHFLVKMKTKTGQYVEK